MKRLFAKAIVTSALLGGMLVHAADTIKVGVLHSLSGTMAISETTLKDTVLMLIDEQNKKGGILRRSSYQIRRCGHLDEHHYQAA